MVCAQCEQRLALIGISLRHSGHFFVVGFAGGSLRDLEINTFVGFTTKKKIAAATNMNEISALIN